jgi:hypothetical protein
MGQMTTAEFERVARRLGELEDYLRDFAHGLTPTERAPWDVALRLAIAAHGQDAGLRSQRRTAPRAMFPWLLGCVDAELACVGAAFPAALRIIAPY